MTSLAKRERYAIAQTLRNLGPDAPKKAASRDRAAQNAIAGRTRRQSRGPGCHALRATANGRTGRAPVQQECANLRQDIRGLKNYFHSTHMEFLLIIF